MKPLFFFVLLVCQFSAVYSFAQKSTMKIAKVPKEPIDRAREQSFALSIIAALQSNNPERWVALYPTNAEYRLILETGLAAGAEGLTQSLIDEMLVRRESDAAGLYAAQFGQWVKLADSLGFSWKEIQFRKITCMDIYPLPVKLKYLQAEIWFAVNERIYVIDAVQAVDITAGYKLQGLAGVRKADAEEEKIILSDRNSMVAGH